MLIRGQRPRQLHEPPHQLAPPLTQQVQCVLRSPVRERALEFQRTVDKLFSLGGFRGETDENPIQLARKFRQMAGFSTDEIDELSEVTVEAQAEAEAMATAEQQAS